jgi:5-methylcytosine-specific restriction endonuclease McrA
MRKVLLLNASEEVIKIIDWTRGVQLYVSGRAIKPYNYEDSYQILTTSGIFHLPSALVLNQYVRIPRNKLRPSKKNLIIRDEKICQYCTVKLNDETLTIDHILPKSRGGKNVWENMVCCCLGCNRKKGNKTSIEAKMPLIKPPKPVYTLGCNPDSLHETELKMWQRWVII